MIHTETTSIKNAYLTNIRKILKHGTKTNDERGNRTIEIQNLHTTIDFKMNKTKPSNEILKGSIWNKEKLQEYCKQILNPSDKGFIYDYGNRLRGFDIDQIENTIIRLNQCRESRRATAVTLRPDTDYNRNEIPCLIMTDAKIRNNFLTLTAIFRSNDMYGASYSNLNGLYAIAEHICNHLEKPAIIGRLECHHISAHIYESDKKAAEKLIKMNSNTFKGR